MGTAAVAAVIGGGGLGDYIYTGIKLDRPHLTIVGALLTALLAIMVDGLLQLVERRITSPGLRLSES